MKNYGAITNSARSVWTISPSHSSIVSVDGNIVKEYKNISDQTLTKNQKPTSKDKPENIPSEAIPQEAKNWRQRVYDILTKMDPYAFERLTQRVLRECGFTDVTVTKRSGDGGIDGFGKLKISGIISFNIAFQCKRYQGMVGSPVVRDFRGSLTKNIEKGVLITTGTFSKNAQEEAENPGKQQIDLINGEDFIDLLAEYSIGLKEVTDYEIDEDFFFRI